MAKIILSEPEGPYKAILDTEVMQVELREVFLGVFFTSPDGEQLGVSMRDSGFEVSYNGKMYEFKNNLVELMGLVIDRVEKDDSEG